MSESPEDKADIELIEQIKRKKELAQECHRQSRLLHDDPNEKQTLDWIERAADTDEW